MTLPTLPRSSMPSLLLLLLFYLSACSAQDYETLLQSGDIIFQVSNSRQSQAIQLATHSKYSHMGMIYLKQGKPYVYEAVQPVQSTPLADWITRGREGHFVVKRLRNAAEMLTQENLRKMQALGNAYQGKDYDVYFSWDDEKIYCSELVWKIYHQALGIELAPLQQMREFDLSHPEVKRQLQQRYGDNIPLSERVIAPAAIFDSPLLETVYTN